MIIIDKSNSVYSGKIKAVDDGLMTIIHDRDFDTLESLFMEKLEGKPDDFSFFISILHSLVQIKEYEYAELFFQLIMDSQKEYTAKEDIRGFLMGILRFWGHGKAQEMLAEQIKNYYNADDNFGRVLEISGFPDEDKPLKALEKAESLLQYSEGSSVYMKGKGVGRINDVNLKLGVIRAVFDKNEKLSFRFDEASRLLSYLPHGHILHDKLNSPEKLTREAYNDPGGILQRLFSDIEAEMSASEIKQHLFGIIPAEKWESWWKKACRDPRLIVSSGKKPLCRWKESQESAEKSLVDEFNKSPLDKKLIIARRESSRSDDLAAVMKEQIGKSAREIIGSDPSKALEAFLTLEKISDGSSESLKTDIKNLLLRADARGIIRNISQKSLRKEALAKLSRLQSGWENIYSLMLKEETDFSLISFMYKALSEKVRTDIIGEITAYPSRAPRFYVWLCREMMKSDKMKKTADWKFLKGLCASFKNESMKKEHAELRSLFDPGKLADQAVKNLTLEEARQFLSMLEKDIGIESYRKDDMVGYILQQFPGLDSKKEEPLYVTQHAIEKKRKEYEKIVKLDIPNNTKEIKRAKEFGDLKENFEYHEARRKQELLSSQAKTFHDELVKSRAITSENIDISRIGIGTEVELCAGTEKDISTIRILGPWDSDPDKNIYSYLAPAVKSILGAGVGDSVNFNGRRYEVKKISAWE